MKNENYNFDLILKEGNVVLPNQKIEKLDIGIVGSQIVSLGNLSAKKTKKKLDIKNLLVIPGPIDTQVHFREPGLTHKEDIYHGTMGAALGGVTSIFEMPNTNPPTINEEELEKKFLIAETNGFCNFSFFVGATKENVDDLNKLESYPGCCGVKIFMGSSTGNLLVEDDANVTKILNKAKKMVAVHSEDEYRLAEQKKKFYKKSLKVSDHPKIRDVESALLCTKRLLNVAKKVKKKIHILHLSTLEEVTLLSLNKKIATCEATPQHLYFSSPECYERLGNFSQMNPPIRSKAHRDALWNGISKGIIDVVGSDHAPHTIEEKKKKYPDSPSGMTGVQTLLPIMLDFVNKGKLSIFDLVRLLSINPCNIYDVVNKGKIMIGYDADLTVVDLKREYRITNNWIKSKSKWTPYDNLKIKGMPTHTIINGNIVMSENEIVSKPLGKKIIFKY